MQVVLCLPGNSRGANLRSTGHTLHDQTPNLEYLCTKYIVKQAICYALHIREYYY